MHAVLDELAGDLSGKVAVYEMDVTQNFDLAGDFGIMATPTLILFKNGTPQWQYVGAMPKDKVRQKIEPMLN